MRSIETAQCCAHRSVGVVLTGTLGDGAGLQTLKQAGGITVVQDPEDAAYAEMPATALDRSKPDHIVSLAAMPALLQKLVHEPAGELAPTPENVKLEVEIAKGGFGTMTKMDRIGLFWLARTAMASCERSTRAILCVSVAMSVTPISLS